MKKKSEILFFEKCSQAYPESINKLLLEQTLSISSEELTTIIQKYERNHFPLETTEKSVRLTLPLLSTQQLTKYLRTKTIGRSLHFHPIIDSTNLWIKKQPLDYLENGDVIFAHKQTAGYGRNGKVWETPAGKSIALSIVLKPNRPIIRPYLLTQLTAVALFKCIYSYGSCTIKWPNDLLINQKKIAGILTESVYFQKNPAYIQIGIGINTNLVLKDFPDDLQQIATSLRIENGRIVEPNKFIADFLLEFEILYNNFICTDNAENFLSICREHSNILGKPITLSQQQSTSKIGIAKSINEDGFLEVYYPETQKVELITAGEVSIRPLY